MSQSPWALPALKYAPGSPPPSKMFGGKRNQSPVPWGDGKAPGMINVPSRDSINTDTKKPSDKSAGIRRGGI